MFACRNTRSPSRDPGASAVWAAALFVYLSDTTRVFPAPRVRPLTAIRQGENGMSATARTWRARHPRATSRCLVFGYSGYTSREDPRWRVRHSTATRAQCMGKEDQEPRHPRHRRRRSGAALADSARRAPGVERPRLGRAGTPAHTRLHRQPSRQGQVRGLHGGRSASSGTAFQGPLRHRRCGRASRRKSIPAPLNAAFKAHASSTPCSLSAMSRWANTPPCALPFPALVRLVGRFLRQAAAEIPTPDPSPTVEEPGGR